MMNSIDANPYFETGDWLVIAVYLVGIVGLGLWFVKDQKSTRDYFLGSRNIPWWGIGFSIVAAETSALTIIGVPAIAYGNNLTFIQMIIGYIIARIILAVLLVLHYFSGEIYSPYQLFANAFGPAVRKTAAGFFLVSETIAGGFRVYVACIPIQLMFGIKIIPAIVLFVFLSLLYTYFGGVKAVIWTDAVQFLLFMAGGIFTLLYIPQQFDGGFPEVFSRAAHDGKLVWLNTKFSWALASDGGFNLWMGIIGGTVMVMSSHGAEQLIVQRVLACKTVADGRKALVLSAVIILPLFLVFLLVGAMLWVYYRQLPMAIPIPEPRPGVKPNDYVYPIFMLTAVPNILKGFLIVAILSAAMSSASSALTSLASVSTMDFLKGHGGKAHAEEFYLRFSRYSTAWWGLLLSLVAFAASQRVNFVLNAAFSLRGLTSGALLGGLLLAVVWKKGRALPVVFGMVTSLAVMTCITAFWKTLIGWPWYTLIGTAVTALVALLARELLPKENSASGTAHLPVK